MKTLGPVKHTFRGFEYIEFSDRNGTKCILQVSSIADYEKPGISAVYIGPTQAEPIIMASKAEEHGVKTKEVCGWVPFPIHDDVFINTRAHLHRDQVEALILHLQHWLNNDTLNPEQND